MPEHARWLGMSPEVEEAGSAIDDVVPVPRPPAALSGDAAWAKPTSSRLFA